jgi:hypothetical protein
MRLRLPVAVSTAGDASDDSRDAALDLDSTDDEFIPARSSQTPFRLPPRHPARAAIAAIPGNFILNESGVPTVPEAAEPSVYCPAESPEAASS